MKFKRIPLIVLTCLLSLLCSCWSEAERLRQQREEEQHRRLSEAGQQLSAHRSSLHNWQIAASSAAAAALLLLVVGTALGSHTRHAAARTDS